MHLRVADPGSTWPLVGHQDGARHDALTGLADRRAFEPALAEAVDGARRTGGLVALVYADLDGFKRVNDGLGHDVGDQLLRIAADRLREVAGPAGTVARLGGDEFVVLIRAPADEGAAGVQAIAERVADTLAAPYALGAAELLVGASVGVSLYPGDADGPETLVKHADAAMYAAKASGGGVALHHAGMADPIEVLALAAQLRRAIERDELVLHYQPIFRLADRCVKGVEALVRWEDPARGLVPPDAFIPVAERTGVIEPLGDWVLEALCRQGRAWQDRGLLPNFGINVAPRQLRRPGAAQRFADRVTGHGLDPSRFVLELTESAWSLDGSQLMPVLAELRALGFGLAIDDFGAGYSSLWRLRELPVQVIKIDRSFLQGVPQDPRPTAMVSAILSLAEACGCDVVAEGIEDAAQAAHLADEGCLLGQGYHLGRPVPAAELEGLLTQAIVPERRRG